MRVRPAPGRPESMRNPLIEDLEMQEEIARGNYGVAGAEILEGNIGVLDIRFFPGTQAARPTDEQAVTATFTVAPMRAELKPASSAAPWVTAAFTAAS